MLPYLTNERTTTAWRKRNCRCEIYFSKECMSDAQEKCLLGNVPPRKNASWIFCDQEKYLLRKKVLSSIMTLQVHITTSEASSFFHLSVIVANACQKLTVFYTFCLAVQRYVSFSCKVLLVLLAVLAGCSSLASINMFLILYVIGSYVTCLQVEITFFPQEAFFPSHKISRRHSF